MQTTADAPFGHLTPFVVEIVRKRVEAGASLTPALVGECLRQAADEDNARCLRWTPPCDGYESSMRHQERMTVLTALSSAVYHAIPPGAPKWNQRWLECAAELGIEPDQLRTVDYLTWHPTR